MSTNYAKMKKFINLIYAADVATSTAPVAELTSPLLVELKAKYVTAWQAQGKFTDPFSQEAKDAKMAAFKIEGEIAAEMARLNGESKAAEIAAKRNERLKLVETLLDAQKAILTAPKNIAADKMAELQTTFDTAKEVVSNELLAKYAASRPAKAKVEGETSTKTEGGANKEAILELARAGKTQKEIIEAGYKRSTVWHTINNAKIAGETFANS